MKASELIGRLTTLVLAYGDMEVMSRTEPYNDPEELSNVGIKTQSGYYLGTPDDMPPLPDTKHIELS